MKRMWMHAAVAAAACCFARAEAAVDPQPDAFEQAPAIVVPAPEAARAAAPVPAPAASRALAVRSKRKFAARGKGAAPSSNRSPSADLVHPAQKPARPLDTLLAGTPDPARTQVEREMAASGTRAPEARGLRDGALDAQMRKAQQDDADSAPSLSIGRTTPTDTFTGRPQSARTEVKLGVRF
jgi:hypothetical protein